MYGACSLKAYRPIVPTRRDFSPHRSALYAGLQRKIHPHFMSSVTLFCRWDFVGGPSLCQSLQGPMAETVFEAGAELAFRLVVVSSNCCSSNSSSCCSCNCNCSSSCCSCNCNCSSSSSRCCNCSISSSRCCNCSSSSSSSRSGSGSGTGSGSVSSSSSSSRSSSSCCCCCCSCSCSRSSATYYLLAITTSYY